MMTRILCIIYCSIGVVFSLIGASRVKRVLHGLPVASFHNTDYEVFKYYVWIGSGHNCDTPLPGVVKDLINKGPNYELNIIGGLFNKIGRICSPKPHHLQCGGSLLTPFVVQTACHCLSILNKKSDDSYEYYPPVKKNAYEVGFTVHPSRQRVEEILVNQGVYTKDFIIHPKCEQTSAGLFHDYGLILLHSSFEPYQTNYAPVYPAAELARMYLDLTKMNKVCMVIGFGTYSWLPGKPYVDDVPLKSDVMRHGWVVAMDMETCYRTYFHRTSKRNQEDFMEKVTSFCASTLPNKYNLTYGAKKGDSGGPVTCDNQYVGLVCCGLYGSLVPEGPIYDLSSTMSTAFSLYENAAEYRAELSYKLWTLYNSPDDPFKNYLVTQPPIKVFIGDVPFPTSGSSITFSYHSYFSILITSILLYSC